MKRRMVVATGIGVVMCAAGYALAVAGLGLTGFYVAIAVFTPLSLLAENRAAQHGDRSR